MREGKLAKAKAPFRSIRSGTLIMENLTVPVKLYKGFETLGFPTHTFHENCTMYGGVRTDSPVDGRIRQLKFCEIHDNVDFPAMYSGIPIEDKIVPLSPESRKN